MKTISMMAVAAAIAFSAVSFTATPGSAKSAKAAKAEPSKPAEHYCLSYEAGSECGFTSYAQCEATASGIGGDCKLQDAPTGAQHHPGHQ